MKSDDSTNTSIIAKPRCGIIMPMSACDGCSDSHWSDVRDILTDAIEDAGFEANLVSDADDVGVIQKRIIQNLYENPIVVCDVSGKNPNVMFELGMRLAFDKPTVIVKDDKTTYSFDTSPIEHIGYPRDLRFNQIVEFKSDLADKLKATHQRATSDPDFTPFLKHFGKFTVAKIDTKEVPTSEYILEELKTLSKSVSDLSTTLQKSNLRPSGARTKVLCTHSSKEALEALSKSIAQFGAFTVQERGPEHHHFVPADPEKVDWTSLLDVVKKIVANARVMPSRA